MNAAESLHVGRVADVGCVICRMLGHGYVPCDVHHVAEGSGLRSWYAVAGLCPGHHTGKDGLHGMGTKRFCAAYRIPGETEWGLLVMVNEWIAKVAA